MSLRDARISNDPGGKVSASATGGAAVTPHDSTVNEFAALWIGGAGGGALKVTTPNGDVLTFAGVPGGTFFPVATKLVWSTGTDVTNIVGLRW